jgi:hypothetical protein
MELKTGTAFLPVILFSLTFSCFTAVAKEADCEGTSS